MWLLDRAGLPSGARVGLVGLVLWACFPWVRAAGAAGPADDPQDAVLALGQELFVRQWVPNDRRSHGGDGLGPVYNERSCVSCHHQGPAGAGGGSVAKNIEIVTPGTAGSGSRGSPAFFYYAFAFQYGPNGFESAISDSNRAAARRRRLTPSNLAELAQIHPGFRDAPGVVLHRYGSDADYRVWREWVLAPHGAIVLQTSQRNPSPLHGAGLIDAIPDAVIEAGARRKHPGSAAVSGRVGRLADGRLGRFGWKAQSATLRDFVFEAAARELGLEVPGHSQAGDPRIPPLQAPGLDMNGAECDALVAFVRSLPAPVPVPMANPRDERARKAGKALFKSIGCAECHVEKLGEVEGLYSDLLLHAMSPELGDVSAYGALPAAANDRGARPAGERPAQRSGIADQDEWRTPPLWGLRDSAPYMHDGRAGSVDEAIRLHGGEAQAAAQRYRQLTARDQAQLQSFLLSLAASELPRALREP
jgi:CxxC motif-containing protein (DUF1111 family)